MSIGERIHLLRIVIVIYSPVVNVCACNIPLPTHRKRRPRARTLDLHRDLHRDYGTLSPHVYRIDASAIPYARMDVFCTHVCVRCTCVASEDLDVTAQP